MTERYLHHPLEGGCAPHWAHAWGEDDRGVWTAVAVAGVEHRLRWVPPGRFWMGSPESEVGRYDDEGPRHDVTLSHGLWLGETPVTQALYEVVVGSNPSHFRGAQRPVENVSWKDTQVFFQRFDQLLGLGGWRLPWEAEWEYACRAGTETATYAETLPSPRIGEPQATLEDIAWYSGNSGGETHPVGEKLPNGWGFHDLLGNVLEWCGDWKGPYGPKPVVDPKGPEKGSSRVLRGGSWGNGARSARAAYRNDYDPGLRFRLIGFRLARGQGAPGRAERGSLPAERARTEARDAPEGVWAAGVAPTERKSRKS